MAQEKQTQTPEDQLPLDQFLTFRMSKVQAKLNAQAIRILRDKAGLTLSQWRIIALIGAAGTTRSSELTGSGLFDKGLLSRNLQPLIADGVVASTPNELDSRSPILALTPKGQTLFENTLPLMRRRQAGLRNALDQHELDVLYRALDKLEVISEQTEF